MSHEHKIMIGALKDIRAVFEILWCQSSNVSILLSVEDPVCIEPMQIDFRVMKSFSTSCLFQFCICG